MLWKIGETFDKIGRPGNLWEVHFFLVSTSVYLKQKLYESMILHTKAFENQLVNLLANIGISMKHRKITQIQQKYTNKILLIKQSKFLKISQSIY